MARALTVGSIVLALCAASSTICLGQDSVRVFERTGVVVPADTLSEYLCQGYKIHLVSCVIEGSIDYHDTVKQTVEISECIFGEPIDFSNTTFVRSVGFFGTQFQAISSFLGTEFHAGIGFDQATFSDTACFDSAWFAGMTGFHGTRFETIASFDRAQFHGHPFTSFSHAEFLDTVTFVAASCSTRVLFNDCRFESYVNFAGAEFYENCSFWGTQFNGFADFVRTNLVGHVYFRDASFAGQDERKSYPLAASFHGAKLLGSSLFHRCDVSNFLLQVDTISQSCMNSLATATGLKNLRYYRNAGTLSELKHYFKNNHYRQPEREVTCALERHNQPFIKRLLIDWPFEYGSNLGRPFIIVGCILVLCALTYFVLFRSGGRHGVYMIKSCLDPKSLEVKKELISFERILGEVRGMRVYMFSRIKVEAKLVRWAFFYSLISTFNVGFRDVDFGRWLRLVLPFKAEFEPFGLVKTVSGFQAIFSVMLMALGLLFYFGRFFD